MKIIAAVAILLILAFQAKAGEEEKEIPQFDIFPEQGMARGLLEFPVYSFYLGSPDVNGVAYVPNFSPRLGLSLSWKTVSLKGSVALPLPQNEIDRRGNSEQLSLILNRYWRQYGITAYFQRYKGFYVSSPLTELDFHKPDRYPQLPDATIFNYGMNFYYVIEPEHYSLAAAFNQTEFQAFTGGSWLLTIFYNHLNLDRGNRFVAGSDPNSLQSLPNLESSALDTLGGGFGYGHTWVQERRFIALQALLGAGPQLQKIGESNGDLLREISPAAKVNFIGSAGYNLKTFSYGVELVIDSLFSNVKGVQVSSSLVLGQIFFGGRF